MPSSRRRAARVWKRVALGILSLALAVWAGCAHTPRTGSTESLRTATDRFHLLLRWGDLRGAVQFVVPERRLQVLKSILDAHDDENLRVMDYELEDAQVLATRAVVLSKVSWMRLPSVTAHTETMTASWVYRDGAWFIEEIVGGPIPFAREAPDGGNG